MGKLYSIWVISQQSYQKIMYGIKPKIMASHFFHLKAHFCLNNSNIMENAIVILHRIHFNEERNVDTFY